MTDDRASTRARPLAIGALAAAVSIAAGAFSSHHLLRHPNVADPALLGALHAAADPEAPAPPPNDPGARLVVVVIDGLGERALVDLADAGAFGRIDWRAGVDVGLPSLSRPVYHLLLTGVPQPVAGIYTNGHVGPQRADGLTDRVRDAGGEVAFLLEGVPWFQDLFARDGDLVQRGARAIELDAFAAAYRSGARLLIVHVTRTDGAGHAHGAASPEYAAAGREAAEAVSAMRGWAAHQLDAPRTFWFVGADHGHLNRGGHGGPEPEVAKVTWLGFFPEPPPGGPMMLPGRAPMTRLAPTFAAALGVPPPRHALGEALPLPGRVDAPSVVVAARREKVAEAQRENDRDHRGAGLLRVTLVAALWLALLRWASGSWKTAGAGGIALAGAAAAYLAGGTGTTLSAIREVEPFVLRALAALGAGAALSWPFARARGARFVPTAVAAAGPSLMAFAFTGGAWGELVAHPVAFFCALLVGLLPAATVGGVAAAELARALRDRASRSARWRVGDAYHRG